MTTLDPKCACAACGNDTPFEIPEPFYEALCNGDVVLFAGAGISTENRFVFPSSLAEEIARELGLDESLSLRFPDLMSRFCEQPNGRAMLLRKIRNRFEYVESFSDLYWAATKFHRELATLFPIQNIITTNWDDYFERVCGATPFVHSEDFVFWDTPGRKVFKIHGSINNLGSLVITRTDYERTFERLSQDLIGSNLRMMLGTKTLVYIGFSFADDDVIKVHESLTSGMRGLRPQAYIVTPDDTSDTRFRQHALTPIHADGTRFLKRLKSKLEQDEHLIPDQRFEWASELLASAIRNHQEVAKIDGHASPDVVFAWSYEDGLIHALQRILDLRKTGRYSHRCDVIRGARAYKPLRAQKLRQRRYYDVAYIDGYVDGHLVWLEPTLVSEIPFYYSFGKPRQLKTLKAFKRALKRKPSHRRSHELARKLVSRELIRGGVLQHTPFLN